MINLWRCALLIFDADKICASNIDADKIYGRTAPFLFWLCFAVCVDTTGKFPARPDFVQAIFFN